LDEKSEKGFGGKKTFKKEKMNLRKSAMSGIILEVKER